MRVILTSKTVITSKSSGQKFDLYEGIDSSGRNVQVFLNEEQQGQYLIPVTKLVGKDVLADMFKELPSVDVSFNQKGRFESITFLFMSKKSDSKVSDLQPNKCIVDTCIRISKSHGLCSQCYNSAANLIKKSNGSVTWDILVNEGLASPVARGNSPFLSAYRGLK